MTIQCQKNIEESTQKMQDVVRFPDIRLQDVVSIYF